MDSEGLCTAEEGKLGSSIWLQWSLLLEQWTGSVYDLYCWLRMVPGVCGPPSSVVALEGKVSTRELSEAISLIFLIIQQPLIQWPEYSNSSNAKILCSLKVRVFMMKLRCSVNVYSVRLVKRQKPRYLRRTRWAPTQQTEENLTYQRLLTLLQSERNTSPLLSRCYQQMLKTWPTLSSDNEQRRPL